MSAPTTRASGAFHVRYEDLKPAALATMSQERATLYTALRGELHTRRELANIVGCSETATDEAIRQRALAAQKLATRADANVRVTRALEVWWAAVRTIDVLTPSDWAPPPRAA